MQSLYQDLRYGVRQLLNSPGFTTVAVLSMALGIGANTALFSLVDAVLLKMLPVKKPEELVLFKWANGPRGISFSHSGTIFSEPGTALGIGTSFSVPAFELMRAHTRTLSDLIAFAGRGELNVSVDGQAEMASGQLVSGNFHSGLGVQPVLGRMINNDDDHTSANPVAVISYRYWRRKFVLDPAVVGKTINVNGAPFTIVGVTPPQFYSGMEVGDSPDLALPLSLAPLLDPGGQTQSEMAQSWYWWVKMMGRVKPGVSLEQVRSELEGVFQRSALAGWESMPNRRTPNAELRELPRLRTLPGGQGDIYLRQSYEQPLRVMLIVVGLTLLVACANIANLLLARSVTRRQEMAVRLALGAGRFRLVRQMLTESLLLAFFGSALGWLLAWSSKNLLLMWSPGRSGQLDAELHMDWRVFVFTTAIALLTGLLFGLAPAIRATRVELNSAIKENARGSKGSLSVLGKSLVIVQVAVSLVLLVGAGLFIRTLHNLQNVAPGFNAENLLLFRLDPRTKGYSNEQIAPLLQRVCERVETVPGVKSVTISEFTPLSGAGNNGPAFVEGRAPASEPDNRVFRQRVRWNYHQTMDIPLLAGRGLTPQDDEHALRVAVINQTMARRYFGEENPLGKRFRLSQEAGGQIEIVGVARDSRYLRLRREIPSIVYLPFPQNLLRRATFIARTIGDPMQMTAAIRAAVRDVDKDLPLFEIKTQTEQIDQSLAQERFFPKLTGLFGLLALLLSSIGIYGVMSYSVEQRTHEIGIRMALGATQNGILRRVIGHGMLLAAIGVVIGSATSFALMRLIASNATYELTRFISGFLYGVRATDPLTFVVVAVLLVLVALLACYLPARRATKVDPIVALRYE